MDWDQRYLELARHIATWSKDPSTKVGCVIATTEQLLGTGYNGFPRGIRDTDLDNRELKLLKTVHAEANAILAAKPLPSNATLYVWPLYPCPHCASLIIQAGIRRVVCQLMQSCPARWLPQFEVARSMFQEAKVVVHERI